MKYHHLVSLVSSGGTTVLFAMTSCVQPPSGTALVNAVRCPAHPETQFLDEKAPALSPASMLFTADAGAQTPNGPVVNGRHLQPTQQQLENTEDKNVVEWKRWNNHVQPDVDRLYDEIMRATTRP